MVPTGPSKKHHRFGNGYRPVHWAFVPFAEAMMWPLHNGDSLEDALFHYILNFSGCPEHIRNQPTKHTLKVYLKDFQIGVAGPPMQTLTEYADPPKEQEVGTVNGPVYAEWIRLNEDSPWILRSFFGE